jgi:hypothetical protein
MFGFRVELSPVPLARPRENDTWLMHALECLGFREEELIQLNKVRCCQQVLFISDVFDASGQALGPRYLHLRLMDADWSSLLFPNKLPPQRDVQLWQEALHLLASWGCAQHHLGRLIEKGHKIWEWRLATDQEKLFRACGRMMVYIPLTGEGRT